MNAGGVGLGPMELICIGMFIVLMLGTAGGILFVVIWRRTSPVPDAPVNKPQPKEFFPVAQDMSSHVEVVAKIARRFCPKCRAMLTSDSPEGLCPACLLAGGLSGDHVGSGGQATALLPDVATLQAQLPADIEIIELLGQGGMGAVYKARQKNLDRLVALKIIRPDNAADPSFGDRFLREARALAKLNHPNIVMVHDFGRFGKDSENCYLVMEYIDGVNLRQTMQAGKLSPAEALAIVPQICDALQYAHDQGVVHRDIKPENVLLDRLGRVKIADFGLAKLLGINPDSMTLTLTQHVVGTPRYMAPEQIDKPTTVDHRADIYSLGVVIYEMLTGEMPVGHFPLPSERVQVDVRIDEVVLRALAREPEKRFQKASQLKSGLVSAASWPSPPTKPMPITAELLPDRLERVRRIVRGPAIGLMGTGGLGVALLLLMVLAAGAMRGGRYAHAIPLSGLAITYPHSVAASMCANMVPVILGQTGYESPVGGQPTWLLLIGILVILLTGVPSLLIFAGGWQMLRLETYGLALIAAIMALIPICTLGWLLGLPMGIWALTVLSRRDVREAFGS
jgi:tRNA A-37 threonylcarbamoyl transferase component Bud32